MEMIVLCRMETTPTCLKGRLKSQKKCFCSVRWKPPSHLFELEKKEFSCQLVLGLPNLKICTQNFLIEKTNVVCDSTLLLRSK